MPFDAPLDEDAVDFNALSFIEYARQINALLLAGQYRYYPQWVSVMCTGKHPGLSQAIQEDLQQAIIQAETNKDKAQRGNALTFLGLVWLIDGRCKPKIMKGAALFFEEAIKWNNRFALTCRGFLYWEAQDEEAAIAFYQRGVAFNEMNACAALGAIYLKKHRIEEGLALLNRAVESKSALAMKFLGNYYWYHSREPHKALPLYEAASNLGLAETMVICGNLYEKNHSDIPRDLGMALYCYERAIPFGEATEAEAHYARVSRLLAQRKKFGLQIDSFLVHIFPDLLANKMPSELSIVLLQEEREAILKRILGLSDPNRIEALLAADHVIKIILDTDAEQHCIEQHYATTLDRGIDKVFLPANPAPPPLPLALKAIIKGYMYGPAFFSKKANIPKEKTSLQEQSRCCPIS